MKMNGIFKIMVMLATFSLVSCSDEDDLKPSESLGIPEMFSPAADVDARVKEMYNDYGLWVRMDFTDWHEVTNAYLYEDVNNRMGATMIDDTCRENAIIFSQTLLSNVSKEFAKAYFPLELFFVKTYNGSWWAADYAQLGRSRFVLCWPNQMEGALPVTKEANPDYYYQDSLISGLIWKNFGTMIASMNRSKNLYWLEKLMIMGKLMIISESNIKKTVMKKNMIKQSMNYVKTEDSCLEPVLENLQQILEIGLVF